MVLYMKDRQSQHFDAVGWVAGKTLLQQFQSLISGPILT